MHRDDDDLAREGAAPRGPPTGGAVDFRRVFEAAPGPALLLAPDLTMVAASDAYLALSAMRREDLVGRHLFDVFPGDLDDPASSGARDLRASLDHVRRHLVPDAMPVQRYDAPVPDEDGGGLEERHWSPVNVPVLEERGGLLYILHRLEDVTAPRRDRRLKDEFLTTVSHELRTPLTSVIGYLGLVLEGGYALEPEVVELLEVARRNGERLGALVGDLLLIAQAQADRLPLRLRTVALDALIEHAVVAARPAADAAGLRIEWCVDPVPLVVADPAWIGRLLDNLVANAVKFTPAGGVVRVTLSHRPGCARISVADTGPGIPDNERSRLFERFHRTRGAVEGGVPGTGLGLSIAKEIAEAHGGRIGLDEAGSEGSVFVVELPLAPEGDRSGADVRVR